MSGSQWDTESVIEEIKRFLPPLIDACGGVSDLFYLPVTERTWQEFGELVQAFDDLYKTSSRICREIEESGRKDDALLHVFADFTRELQAKFESVNRHIDDENYVQAADEIRYELAEMFVRLKMSLGDEKAVIESRFAANLAFLKENYQYNYTVMRDVRANVSDYRIKCAKNGLPNLEITAADGRVISLYSHYDPEYEAKKWAESLRETVAGKTNVIVYGFGFGYHLQELVRLYPQLQLVIFEPDEQILHAAMRTFDLQELFARLPVKKFVAGWDRKFRDFAFHQFAKLEKGDTAVVSIPVYDKLDLPRKLEFFEDAKSAIMVFEVSARTRALFGLQWLQNKLYNLAAILNTPSLQGLKDKLQGVTAVVVGAGPSLEPDIELLRELKNHALIIAAGSSIQSLTHYGITPHLVVSVDGSDANYDAFKHLDIREVPILFSPLIKYKIIEDKKKRIHFLLDGDFTSRYVVEWRENDPIFLSPPSVTGPAIQAAIYMGCREIVLTGQDLSYPSEHIYAPGAKHVSKERNDQIIKEAVYETENVGGGMNRTTTAMRATLHEIEKLLELFPDVRFINASRWGAKIRHTEFEPMESVLKRLQNKTVPCDLMDEFLERHLQPYPEERRARIIDRLTRMPKQLEEMEAHLLWIEKKLYKLPEWSRTKPDKCLNAMVEIEDRWEPVMMNELFVALIGVAIPEDVRIYDRDLPELVQERNVIRKADLFCSVLGPLIEAMKNCLPLLNGMVQEAIRRVEQETQLNAEEISR